MRNILTKLRLVLAELARPGAMRDDGFAWAAVVGLAIDVFDRVKK